MSSMRLNYKLGPAERHELKAPQLKQDCESAHWNINLQLNLQLFPLRLGCDSIRVLPLMQTFQ